MGQEFCCDRCKAAPEKKGYDDEIDQESAAAVRLTEVQTNFGLLWMLCIDCRKDWYKWLNSHSLMKEYSQYNFRLRHWTVAHRKTGTECVEKGIAILNKLNELEDKLMEEGTKWLATGQKALTKTRRRDDYDSYGD